MADSSTEKAPGSSRRSQGAKAARGLVGSAMATPWSGPHRREPLDDPTVSVTRLVRERRRRPGWPWAAGSAPVGVGDGQAPVLAEGLGGEPDPGRALAALVLGPVDQAHDAQHRVAVEAV